MRRLRAVATPDKRTVLPFEKYPLTRLPRKVSYSDIIVLSSFATLAELFWLENVEQCTLPALNLRMLFGLR